jgi:hypothetical protein
MTDLNFTPVPTSLVAIARHRHEVPTTTRMFIGWPLKHEVELNFLEKLPQDRYVYSVRFCTSEGVSCERY